MKTTSISQIIIVVVFIIIRHTVSIRADDKDDDSYLLECEEVHDQYEEELSILDAEIIRYRKTTDDYKSDIAKYERELKFKNEKLATLNAQIESYKTLFPDYKLKSEDGNDNNIMNVRRNQKLAKFMYGLDVLKKVYQVRMTQLSAYREWWYQIYGVIASASIGIVINVNGHDTSHINIMRNLYQMDALIDDHVDEFMIVIANGFNISSIMIEPIDRYDTVFNNIESKVNNQLNEMSIAVESIVHNISANSYFVGQYEYKK